VPKSPPIIKGAVIFLVFPADLLYLFPPGQEAALLSDPSVLPDDGVAMNLFLKLFFPLVFIGGVYSGAVAQVHLTGAISGNYPADQYLISGDIAVPRGMTLSFAPGSVLRFGEYNGIEVHGRFVCKGTPQQPIIFTSANDVSRAATLPEAFDWNGIKVAPEAAGISLEQCTIAYSTFGLNVESNATPVLLKNVAFLHNGSASLTREKKMIPVQETSLITLHWPETGVTAVEAGGQGEPGEPKAEVKPAKALLDSVGADKTKSRRHGRQLRRIAFGAAAAGSGIVGILFQAASNTRYRDYKADHSYDAAQHDREWQSVRNAEKMRNVFYTLAGACTAAFVISIPF
jgi:hypothetical protein